MRFSEVDKGFAARKRGIKFSSLTGIECVCDLRVITGTDDDEILERAAKHTVEKGQTAKRGDPVYDFALACELIAVAALDPDSPDDKPTLYFDGGVEQVRKRLDRDRINFLAEQQSQFQASVAPLKRSLSGTEYWEAVQKSAQWKDGDADPFVDWAPSLRLIYGRTTASLLLASLMSKSSDSEPSSSKDSIAIAGPVESSSTSPITTTTNSIQ